MKKVRNYFIYAFIALVASASIFSSCKKEDEDVKVTEVKLDATSKALIVGESFKLMATVTPTNATNSDLVWSTSDATVAVVGSDGTVAGLKVGSATITVKNEESLKSATCAITVATNIVSVDSVKLDKKTATLKVGEKLTLTASVYPATATVKTVTWNSSATDVAVVSSTGEITALKVGSSIITATGENSKTATLNLTVAQAGNIVTIQGEIAGNRKFAADSVYLLKDFVYVINGAVLTIDAGTIIKGDKATRGTLIIERGGKIMAQGTAQKPIVFTSNQTKGARTYGDWGGVVICGKAKANPTTTPIVEGGPRTEYGGTDDADNSGVLSFVRIEFGGYPFQPDKEINGLTLCAVGSGTQIDHIQVSYCGDDSYEYFGGTVNCKYLVAFRGLDDEFDTDYGYSGKIQYALGIRDYRKADISGSNGFESDNDSKGTTNGPITNPIFSNLTMIGPMDTTSKSISADYQHSMHLRRNTKLNVYNSVFAGWPVGLKIDGDKAWANAQSSELQVKNCVMVGMKVNFEGANTVVTSDIETWYNDAARGNQILANNTVAGIKKSFVGSDETKAPTLLPATSALLTGASYTDAKLSDAFFVKTGTFLGAFGTEDWTAGWCNWNPQNTDY